MAKETASPEPEATVQSPAPLMRIKLINAIDEALILRELLSPKLLRTCELEAMPDSDSTYLLLPPAVVRQLGLRLVDQRLVQLADGREELVGVTEALRIEWNGKFVSEDALVLGDRVVLGQGILKKLALGPNEELTGSKSEFELAPDPVDSALSALSSTANGTA
ncbi:MAG: clan AA aspartic protease [Elainella sp.]